MKDLRPIEVYRSRVPLLSKAELYEFVETHILSPKVRDNVLEIGLLGSFVNPSSTIDNDGISDLDLWIVVKENPYNRVWRTTPDVKKLGDCASRLVKWGYVDVFQGADQWNDDGGRDPINDFEETIKNAEKIFMQISEHDIDNGIKRPIDLQIGNRDELNEFLDGSPYLPLNTSK